MTTTWIGRELPPIRRGGQEYFLLGRGDELYLVLNKCPHRGGPLKLGFLDADDRLVCPLHKNAFSVDWLIALPTTRRLVERADVDAVR